MIFIESKLFEKLREKYLDDGSYQALQNFLLEQPTGGDTMQGTGDLTADQKKVLKAIAREIKNG